MCDRRLPSKYLPTKSLTGQTVIKRKNNGVPS
jgi:hypothetical protein